MRFDADEREGIGGGRERVTRILVSFRFLLLFLSLARGNKP